MKLSQAIDALLIATRADGRSPATVRAYAEKLSYLADFLGADMPVASISVTDLRGYVAGQWARDLSPFTVAGRVRAMKRLFNFLISEGVLAESPARRIKTPRPKRTEPKGVDYADVAAILATCEAGTAADLRDKALILFLVDTAARAGGVAGLRVQDVDLGDKWAWVTEKGGKTRQVFFTDRTARALGAWLEVRPDVPGDWLFVGLGAKSKGGLSGNGILQMLKRRGRRAGIASTVTVHGFRHAFAKGFLLAGGPLAALSDLLGHSDISVTKAFYGVFTRQELRELHARYSPIGQVVEDEGKDF